MEPPIVSFFHCTPKVIQANPALGVQLRRWGIRHLDLNLGHNPAYRPGISLNQWVDIWEKDVGADIEWSVRNGWRLVIRADDWMQFPYQQAQVGWENGRAVSYMAERLQLSRIADWCELCDEMKPYPELYPLEEFFERWYDNSAIPIACPGFQTFRFEEFEGMKGISRQWFHLIAKKREDREALFDASLAALPKDHRRVTCLIPTVLSYTKHVAGHDFNPAHDHVVNPGVSVNGFKRLLRRAVKAVGKERLNVHIYALDTFWKQQRANTPPLSRTLLQKGTGLEDSRFFGFLEALQTILSLPRG